MRFPRFAFAGALVLLAAGRAPAENWPQWRGPDFNGSTTEKDLPDAWHKPDYLRWRRPLPGPSCATPVVWAGRVFVTSLDGDAKNVLAICIDTRTGEELWRQTVGPNRGVARNDMASSSPVTDGKKVSFMTGAGALVAFDLDGKRLWSRDIEKDHGPFGVQFGYSASPLLHEGRLYVAVIHRERAKRPLHRNSYLLAIDAATGKDLWKQARPTDAVVESQEAYTTPIPRMLDGRSEIILVGGDYFTAHDAVTGKETWRWGSYNVRKHENWRVVPTPVVMGELLFACTSPSWGGPALAVRLGDSGDPAKTPPAWSRSSRLNVPDVCSPLYYQGRLFILDGMKRVITCLEPKTGEVVWRGAMGGRAIYRASPTGADGKIYCIDMHGTAVVFEAGEKFRLLARMEMGEMPVCSTIVAADGALFVRTARALHCIANPAKNTPQ